MEKVASSSTSGYYCDLRDMLLQNEKKKKEKKKNKKKKERKKRKNWRKGAKELKNRSRYLESRTSPSLALLSNLLVQDPFLVAVCSRKGGVARSGRV